MKNQANSKNETLGLSKPKAELDKGKALHALIKEASPPKDVVSAPPTAAKEDAQEQADGESVADSSVDMSAKTTLNSLSEEDPLSLSSNVEGSAECSPAKRRRKSSGNSDSDEERLFIADPGSPLSVAENKKNQVTPAAPENITDPNTSSGSDLNAPAAESPSSSAKGAKKVVKRPRVSADCDQLGHILRMQNAMLKSTTAKSQEAQKAPATACRPPEPKPNNHPVSLVKPSVSSYLDLEHREGLQSVAAAPATTSQSTAQRKS